MSREWRFRLDDVMQALQRIQLYIGSMDKRQFLENTMTYDAVIRNLEIIGEATKHVPEPIQRQMPDVPWRNIAAMRNILAHAYFGLDDDLIWDTIEHDLPQLKSSVGQFLRTLN